MSEGGASRRKVRRAARDGFGYEALRPAQLEAVDAVVAGTDVLAVMPTGSGKSAIYQVAGLLLDGPTVVVSPLISLQHDQVRTIVDQGSGGAAQANTAIPRRQRRETLEAVGEGEVEFLFLAPEQFANDETLDRLRASPPSLFVVDEAHCISAWGHDFRPDYLHLGSVVEELGRPVVLALTATASPPVREEIVERLGMRRPLVVVQGFDRPNIRLAVERFHDERAKEEAVVERVAERVAAAIKPGIVYAATRAASEALAATLAERGVRAGAYHGGMKAADRDAVQEAFMADDLDVVVATVAFGLGIDKADVRFVFHLHPSDSLDSYYQEIGRAGRDGEPAEAVLFYRQEDLGLRRFFAGGPRLEEEELEAVARAVQERGPIALGPLAEATGLTRGRVAVAVGWLEREGGLRVAAGGEPVLPATHADDAAPERASEAAEARRRLERSRVEMVRAYAEERGCRRRLLLNYLGEDCAAPCDGCDNCEQGAPASPAPAGLPFAPGSAVVHSALGRGTVMGYRDGTVMVLFDQSGYKTLSVELVRKGGLLRPE